MLGKFWCWAASLWRSSTTLLEGETASLTVGEVRTNAPLIDLAIQLQKEGVPAVMTAPTFCENLKFLLNQVEGAHWIKGHSLLDRAYKYAR